MTVLPALAMHLESVAAVLLGTGHVYDAAMAEHLLQDAQALRLLAQSARHRATEEERVTTGRD